MIPREKMEMKGNFSLPEQTEIPERPGNSERQLGENNNNPERALGAPRENKGWYRRFLLHRDEPGLIQFITYRLADSIPATVLAAIEEEIRMVSPERMDSERRRKIEAMLDMGHGSGVLRNPGAAECIIENWRHFNGQRYDVIAWVVMPTHVHVMIRMLEGESLPRVVQSWKSYTGKRLKAHFPHACVGGEFWMREYWDRYIRDENHFYNAVEYIRQNPMKAGLAKRPDQWPYLGTPSACSEGTEPSPIKHSRRQETSCGQGLYHC